jgi:hypothetical protein
MLDVAAFGRVSTSHSTSFGISSLNHSTNLGIHGTFERDKGDAADSSSSRADVTKGRVFFLEVEES